MRKCLREKCGKEFEPKRPKSKFCSDQCRIYNHRETKANQPKESVISLDEKALEKIAEILSYRFNVQSATIKKVAEKTVSVFDVEVEDHIKEMSYNDYLDVIPKLKSIDECERLDAEIKKLNFAAWQKVELSKRIKLRSQHPDLN